jgi:hypothetical protein
VFFHLSGLPTEHQEHARISTPSTHKSRHDTGPAQESDMAKSRFLSPLPVVVAFFGAGEQVRMSFGQERGKPWEFDRVAAMVKKIIGNERARVGWEPTFADPCPPHPMNTKPADDLLCCYVEWAGQIIRNEPAPSRAEIAKARRAESVRQRDPRRKQVALRVVTGGKAARKVASKAKAKKPTRRAA